MVHASSNLPLFLLIACCYSAGVLSANTSYKGINFSGGEYAGCTKRDVVYGVHYTYPSKGFMDAFLLLGMNTFRIPFCWERIQPQAMGALSDVEFQRLDATVKYLTDRNASVVLDLHNYAAYWGVRISADADKAALADVWKKLADLYKNNPRVIFGLMNEPYEISGETWLDAANGAIAAIRSTGAQNLILVPGVAWSGAHSWSAESYGTPNSSVMKGVVDPVNRYVFDIHQYLDADSSGTSAQCVRASIGADRLAGMTAWLREQKKQAFLSEFGVANNALCRQALQQMLAYLTEHSDAWVGWTYWSAGEWQPNYMFNLDARSDPNQVSALQVMLPYLAEGVTCGLTAGECPPFFPVIREVMPE